MDGDSPHLTGQARGRLACRAAHLRADGVGSGSLGPKLCVCVCVCVMLLGGAVLLATMLPALGWRRAWFALRRVSFYHRYAFPFLSSPFLSSLLPPSSPSLRAVSFASPFSALIACLLAIAPGVLCEELKLPDYYYIYLTCPCRVPAFCG